MMSSAEMSGRGPEASNSFPSLRPPVSSSRKALRHNLAQVTRRGEFFLKQLFLGFQENMCVFLSKLQRPEGPSARRPVPVLPRGLVRESAGAGSALAPHPPHVWVPGNYSFGI